MIYKREPWYWTSFTVNYRAYRKSLRTKNYKEAKLLERKMIAEAETGHLEVKSSSPRTLFPAVAAYLSYKRVHVRRQRTADLEEERLSIVKNHFGDIPLRKITSGMIASFQKVRVASGRKNRTVNMDVGALSRTLKYCGSWKPLADFVKALPEGESIIGQALTAEQKRRLFDTASANPEWEHIHCAAVIAANTGMRRVEVMNLRRKDIDLFAKTVSICRTKNQSGHRIIPLLDEAMHAVLTMIARADSLGFTSPEHYLWFACRWGKFDPETPIKKWDTSWRSLRKKADLPTLRFHDLRHTFISEMAETPISEHVLQSISGHLSRRMLEHYTHIGLAAKKRAFVALGAHREEIREQADDSGISAKAQ